MRHASFARADRVTPRSAAIASMLWMSESGNQNEITRPAMPRHIRFALVLSSTALVLAACGPLRQVKHETIVVDGHTFLCSYTENNLNGNESDPQCVEVGP